MTLRDDLLAADPAFYAPASMTDAQIVADLNRDPGYSADPAVQAVVSRWAEGYTIERDELDRIVSITGPNGSTVPQ